MRGFFGSEETRSIGKYVMAVSGVAPEALTFELDACRSDILPPEALECAREVYTFSPGDNDDINGGTNGGN